MCKDKEVHKELNKDGASFYARSDGCLILSKGYRAIGGPAIEDAMHGNIMSQSGCTYVTFDDISKLSAHEAKSLLQLKYPPTHYAEFDTLQIANSLEIPGGNWNTSSVPEPITATFPEFGKGGGTQAITKSPIKKYSLKSYGK